jgi:AraC-like DNA-binding protein
VGGRVQQWVQLAESKQKIGLIVWWARFLFVPSQAETLTRLSSIMYDQIREDIFFFMFYASVAMLSLIACCYLLFRRSNAIAPDVKPPARLRRWTAAYFAATTLCHLWYLPTYFLTSSDDMKLGCLIAGLLDSMTVIPLTIIILFAMLQDRRRPLWPVVVMVAPLIAGLAWCIATRNEAILPMLYAYILLMWLGLITYMVRATRQYGRWLRDNYADLEHKEVWQSFVVLAIILLVYAIYLLDVGETIYEYAMEVINIVLICYLLWRVETLSDLSLSLSPFIQEEADAKGDTEDNALSQTIRDNIGSKLKRYCEEPQLYLQHDISLPQLAQTIGTNRLYLSQHFSSQGMTYNAYINGLRIQHFINLYREAIAAHQLISVQQLALQSGFRSYSTFNAAFKQSMGMTATGWMRNAGTSES